VDGSGVTSWQSVGGYQLTDFAVTGVGVAPTVEVGSSQTTLAFSATANFPLNAGNTTTSWTGVLTGGPVTGASGSIPGTATSPNNGDQLVVTMTATDPAGAPHTATFTMTYAAKVVWGSITPPETVGQALWNALNAQNSTLSVTGSAELTYTSTDGQDQVFARLASLPAPILIANGNVYPAVLLGTSVITENATPQNVNFYTVGDQGLTFSWSLT
jgi:hypothetical protein